MGEEQSIEPAPRSVRPPLPLPACAPSIGTAVHCWASTMYSEAPKPNILGAINWSIEPPVPRSPRLPLPLPAHAAMVAVDPLLCSLSSLPLATTYSLPFLSTSDHPALPDLPHHLTYHSLPAEPSACCELPCLP
eukprot:1160091-Pelagomonas_calceolata.AAC.3